MEEVISILPERIKALIIQMPISIKENVEEIRVRINRPLEVVANGRPYYPENKGQMFIVTTEDARFLLNQLSQYSLYAFEEELKQGFITIRGGHRVGLAGKVIVEQGKVISIKD